MHRYGGHHRAGRDRIVLNDLRGRWRGCRSREVRLERSWVHTHYPATPSGPPSLSRHCSSSRLHHRSGHGSFRQHGFARCSQTRHVEGVSQVIRNTKPMLCCSGRQEILDTNCDLRERDMHYSGEQGDRGGGGAMRNKNNRSISS